ncbi:MAG: type II secretion system protein [Patescibacteria group bacterium]|nr:type II secretion system protein [Patescibacteria group bacterium]
MHRHPSMKGFTLIEVLVVIGIIAILAAVVLVAVNPGRQFKLARDSQRTANVEALVNAIHQNMSEHRGSFVCGGAARALPHALTAIRGDATDSYAASGYLGDIASCLVPDYISALPFDPAVPRAHFASTTDYDTGYEIVQGADGRITASSTGELVPTIAATQ